MRVIAGELGGRVFDNPPGHKTHPMSEKMRGALFNALGDLNGLSVLDAFAGSGALSFEAVSRGAAQVVAVDSDRTAHRIITENAKALHVRRRVKPVKAALSAWLSTTDQLFDIVLCDPPYDRPQTFLLQELAGRVRPQGLLVLSLPPELEFTPPDSFETIAVKQYGDATLRFYRRKG